MTKSSGNVKGIMFAEYVRMIRANKGIDWSRHLDSTTATFVNQRIDIGQWYPMEAFEQMGLAIFELIAGDDLVRVREWGHRSIDELVKEHPDIFVPGDPRESLMRFQILRQSLFDFSAIRVTSISDCEARFELDYRMSAKAEEAACVQTVGFLERLLEISGARDIEAVMRTRSWDGDETTTVAANWKNK